MTRTFLSSILLLSLVACAPAEEASDTASEVAFDGQDQHGPGGPGAQAQARMSEWLASRYASGALVSTVTGSKGTVFDCVRRSRQPGLVRADGTFDTIATPPAAATSDTALRRSTGESIATTETIGCPTGTVPMAHVELADLERMGSLEAFFAKYPTSGDPEARTGSTNAHQYAKVDKYVDNWGGDGVFNIWNPFVASSSEFSLTQVWVVRGTGSDKQTVEAGIQDYEQLYGDTEPHLFIYSTQDGYTATGCYNGTCGDWVQYSATIAPTAAFANHSAVGGTQYIAQLRWQRDDSNDTWWLMYGSTWVGYYKGTLFDSAGLRDLASRISFGGEIIDDDPTAHTRTDMGSGYFPGGGFRYTAYVRSLRYITTGNVWAAASSPSEFVTDDLCYDAAAYYAAGSWANYFYYGGEGYVPGDCE
jgi:Neprosin